MRKKFLFTVYVLMLFCVKTVSAQDFSCVSDVVEKSMIATNPMYAQQRAELEQFIRQYRGNAAARMIGMGCQQTANVYTIPIVVHVMRAGTEYNPSDLDIQNAITGLNTHFSFFGIQFVLAKRDPNGNVTNGITRTDCSNIPAYVQHGIDWNIDNPIGAPDTMIKGLDIWDVSQYLNVWLVNISVQNAAYAAMFGKYQGIVMYSNSFRFPIVSSIFAHEMGHIMNLEHTFKGSTTTTCAPNDDPYNQGDYCADTPPVLVTDCSSSSCGTFPNINNSLMNAMGYCSNDNPAFTPDQQARVMAALFKSRWELVSSPGLIPVDVATEISVDSIAFEQNLSQPLCNGMLSPKIQIKNYGNTVYSFELLVSMDNHDTTFTVSKNWSRNSTNWLSLPVAYFSTSGSHSIVVKITKVNGVDDYNQFNNVQCINYNVIVKTAVISTVMNNPNAGTITGAGTFMCNGINDTIRVTTNTGFIFQYIKDGNTVVSTDSVFPFTVDVSKGNKTFTAYHSVQTFYVSTIINPSNGGTVTGGYMFNYGSTPTFSFRSKPGYQFVNITENGNVISTDSTVTLSPIYSNRTIEANFVMKTYTVSITTNPTNGGEVVSGAGVFNIGTVPLVAFKSKPGYHFVNATENGNIIKTDSIFYLSALTANRNLVGNFAVNTYSIYVGTYYVFAGCSVSGGNPSVLLGSTITVTATEYGCYSFVGWNEYGELVSTDKNYTFVVTGSRELTAVFSLQEFTIGASANDNNLGSVTGGGTYNCGSNATVRANVKPGGKFIHWKIDGVVVSLDSVYTFRVANAKTAIAYFESTVQKVSAGPDKEICAGSSVTLTATNSTSYVWNTNQSTQSITVSPLFTTTYIVTGLNGTKDTVIVTVKPLPNVGFTKQVTDSKVQFTLTAPDNNTAYHWNFGDDSSAQVQNPLHVYATIGKKYIVLQAVLNGCSNQKRDSVFINKITTGITNHATDIGLNIYPNPTNSFLTIAFDLYDTRDMHMEIMNDMGQIVWTASTVQKQQIINVQDFPKGMYILQLYDGETIVNKRFVVQ